MGDRASDGIISTQAGVTGVGAAEASAAAMPDTVAHVKDQNQLEVVNGHKLDKSDVDDEEDGEGAKKDKKSKKKKKKDDEVVELISIRELFSFADGLDRILIIVGTIAAICNGLAQPLMTLVFGQLINAFGQNTTDTKELVSEVGAVSSPVLQEPALSPEFLVSCRPDLRTACSLTSQAAPYPTLTTLDWMEFCAGGVALCVHWNWECHSCLHW